MMLGDALPRPTLEDRVQALEKIAHPPIDLEASINDLLDERLARERVLNEIRTERRRQIEVEGWTPEHDDQHSIGEMALAAAAYAAWTSFVASPTAELGKMALKLWPWNISWFKRPDRRRSLIKAGALIVAELERMDRAELGR